jgi:hypothetical protein
LVSIFHFPVIACDKREAFAQGNEATKQSIFPWRGEMDCFASQYRDYAAGFNNA